MKLMIYSHDAFGLGNIRRMLCICQSLLSSFPNASILVVSGSPALHNLEIPEGLDYIKLPCMGRDVAGEMMVKYLDTEVEEMVRLRSHLIRATIANFKPDLLIVDKKPDGLNGELRETIDYIKAHLPKTRLVLLLRDILDAPEVTTEQWQQRGYYRLIEAWYDQIWVVGTPEVFDVRREYQMPIGVASKVAFCGYIRREKGRVPRALLRQELEVQPDESLVLVTPGGGGDGYSLINTYLQSISRLPQPRKLRSLIISGPEMPRSQRETLAKMANSLPNVQLMDFTHDPVSYLDAADLVVSMGGYNTTIEILSLRKRAIVVPRVEPVQEQWIRAERMAKLGLFHVIHPDRLTPKRLMEGIRAELQHSSKTVAIGSRLDMEGLSRITQYTAALLQAMPQEAVC
jgi:predicted glycosyltransferase